MFSVYFSKLQSLALVAALVCLVAAETLTAASPATAPNVTYTASGTFASPAVSGQDLFKLAGEPFTISVVANAATVPTTHGPHWARYTNLSLTGNVQSGLLPGQPPYPLSSNHTSLEIATGFPDYQAFALFAPVSVLGSEIDFTAIIQMPLGTVATALIHPFAAIPLSTVDTVSYANQTNTTTLQIASGTLVATIPGGAATSAAPGGPLLHAGGAQTVTTHSDGTASIRPLSRGPVELGEPEDMVALHLYASGVADASDVHVRIGGEEATLLYSGASGYFRGLDQVSVQVPRSLAGRGDVEVVLTVDGQTAGPVHIQIR